MPHMSQRQHETTRRSALKGLPLFGEASLRKGLVSGLALQISKQTRITILNLKFMFLELQLTFSPKKSQPTVGPRIPRILSIFPAMAGYRNPKHG